jgi:hypothetical protein
MKFLEVVGITVDVLVIIAFIVVVGAAVLYWLMAKDGQNPFQ